MLSLDKIPYLKFCTFDSTSDNRGRFSNVYYLLIYLYYDLLNIAITDLFMPVPIIYYEL